MKRSEFLAPLLELVEEARAVSPVQAWSTLIGSARHLPGPPSAGTPLLALRSQGADRSPRRRQRGRRGPETP